MHWVSASGRPTAVPATGGAPSAQPGQQPAVPPQQAQHGHHPITSSNSFVGRDKAGRPLATKAPHAQNNNNNNNSNLTSTAPPPTASNTIPHSNLYHNSPNATTERESPAIVGAATAAGAHHHLHHEGIGVAAGGVGGAGVFLSGTRTNYTDVSLAGTVGFGNSATTPSNAGAPGDSNEEEINQLLRELECSVDSPHAPAVMRDALEAIEARALANFDPLSRDFFLEQRIRDVLAELSRTTNERSLLIAVHFIEGLLPIAYTSSQPKFIRLCRSLTAVLQCGLKRPAYEAQRVYKKMLSNDLLFSEPPLKTFVPKELKDGCEQALMQLHGRLQQSKAHFNARYFAIMLTCAVTVEVNPRYVAGQLRTQFIQLATTLAGSVDRILRSAAYDCLCAIFGSTGTLRHNEIIIENRRVCDDAVRSLNSSQHNESSVVSTLKALRALLSKRGIQSMDKQVMPQLGVLVTDQQRVSNKSALVKSAVCDLVPIIAAIDITSPSRRATYCAIIMEPVKNVRDERTKSDELHNVAAFIESVGYEVLDQSNRTNLDSIMHRYISRPETQKACWRILAAICSSSCATTFRKAARSAPSTRSLERVAAALTASGEAPPLARIPSSGGSRSRHSDNNNNTLAATATTATTSAVGNGNSSSNAHTNGSNNEKSSSSQSHPLEPSGGSGAKIQQEHNPESVSSNNSTTIVSCLSTEKPASATVSPTGQGVAGITPTTLASGSIQDAVRRCIPYLANAALCADLVKYLGVVQECVPSVSDDIQKALDHLVNRTLKEPIHGVEKAPRTSGTGDESTVTTLSNPSSLLSGNSSSLAALASARSNPRQQTTPVIGRLTQYFRPSDSSAPLYAASAGSVLAAHHLHRPGQDAMSMAAMTGPSPTSPTGPSVQGSPTTTGASQVVIVSDVTVALEVFSRRPITSVEQLEELKSVIIPFQHDKDPRVRKESSRTTISSLNQWIQYAKDHKTSTYSSRVTEILEAYVKNVLLETDPSCRLEEITLLANAPNLRSFMSEQRILSALLSFLNGSSLVREKTVELLVAITQDPKPSASVVAVQQSLYVTIESCVVVLEYTSEVRTLIRSMADLQTFTRLCVRPLSNHLGRIFYAFRKKLNEDNVPDVVSLSVLKSLEVILIALTREERATAQYQDDVLELYPSVIGILRQTSSPALSHAAIDVLVCMNRMCPCPSRLTIQKQQELITSLSHVYTGSTSTLEELTNMLTLFGQLGALDPSVQPSNVTVKKKNEEAAVQDEADLELTYDYTVIVYRTLSRMLDVSLSEAVCSQALRTLLQFIRHTQDKKDLVGGVHAVRAVVQVAKRSTDSPALRIEALHVLAAVTVMRHERIARLVLPEIVVLLEQLWAPSDHSLFRGVLEVVSALKPGKLSGKEQSESWAWLYPRLVDVALQDRTDSREFCLRVVEIILNASYIPPHCIPIVFPMLIQFVQQSDQLVEVRSQSLCAAIHIVCELKAVQYFSSLLHGIRTLTRHCELNEDLGPRLSAPGVRESLRVLTALHPSGREIIRELRKCLVDTDDHSTTYGTGVFSSRTAPSNTGSGSAASSMPATLASGGGGGFLRRSAAANNNDPLSDNDDDGSGGGVRNATVSVANSGQEISLFMKHIEWGARTKESKLREWFAELQKCIILVSPHPAFQMMVDLFDKHEPLRRELFHPSFKSLYEVLSAEQIKKVNDVLTMVLNCNDSDLSSKCLGLADYLDHNPPNIAPEVLQTLKAWQRADHKMMYSSENESLIHNPSSSCSITVTRALRNNAASPQPLDSNERTSDNLASESVFTFESLSVSLAGDGQPPQQHQQQRQLAPQRTWSDQNTNAKSASLQHLEAHTPLAPNVLFSSDNIVKAAERTRMYDKSLNYLESKLLVALRAYRYGRMPREVIQKVVWPLAWLYNQREMQDSVVGLFRAIRYKGENNDGFGFELLQWWEEAQRVYGRALGPNVLNPNVSPSILEGYVRTLCFCGKWSQVLDVAKQACVADSRAVSSTVARCGATSAWILGCWDDVTQLADCISTKERSDASIRLFFLNGVFLRNAVMENNAATYDALRLHLAQAKLVVNDSLRTLMPLSYSHAYENIALLQHFTEMEETIDYCLSRSEYMKTQMTTRWNTRFMNLKPDSLHPSLRSIMLHSLVLNRTEMSEMVLHFCETMSADYPQLAQWAIDWIRQSGGNGKQQQQQQNNGDESHHRSGMDDLYGGNANVAVGYITHLWSQRRREEAVRLMEKLLEERGAELEVQNATCYGGAQLRLGMWKQDLHADSFWKKGFREEELGHFHKAIRAMPSSHEAWHSWGLMNYRVQQRDHNLSPEDMRTFVEAAHQGFVAAICRCNNSSDALPGIMRLLQLWVIHNGVELLKETVADSISRIPIDHWVQAIPQLIGHLSSDSHDIREVISMIFRSLCEVHPQAVIFPLLVVLIPDDMDSNTDPHLLRKRGLVHSIIQHCPKRIRNEAETMAKLLVGVSAIPIEKIRENLSQVATAWNPNAEYEEDSEEVHRRLRITLDIFQTDRKHLLYTVGDIGQFVQMVIDDDRRGDREKAAGIVNQLVDEISKHVSEKLGKEPQKAMEPLLRIRNSSVAVFGEYGIQNEDSFPIIASFSSKLDVIPSKKRPRRIQLNGSDGCLYTYCLKGNEDIRMDERVMQLFGMVNVLLGHSRTTSSAYIHRFPVIPISSNVGLLGWVENANTINNTICNHRATISRVRTHQESNMLRSYVESFGQWDKLSVIQRTEVLDFVMSSENCEAVDVSRAMWHRANTAEQWLERRTAFTTSLATMSLVGYVLGLGDRHLGNILLSMSTGKTVHIDFGDSFDVGRLRHVLPETVPFRLTRMLTNAMEVFGVDGVFRASATRTQQTLHRNRDSIMAVLSAFVYDPIVQHKGKVKNMMEKSRSPQDVAERTRHKLRGMELAVPNTAITVFNTTPESCRRPDLLFMSKAFDDGAERDPAMALTPEEQVNFLIEEATRTDNYTTLYFGWGPLW